MPKIRFTSNNVICLFVCLFFFFFNLHLSISSCKNFPLILIGEGGLGSLLTSGMKCLIFICCVTVRIVVFLKMMINKLTLSRK